jgi:hypothetical protein
MPDIRGTSDNGDEPQPKVVDLGDFRFMENIFVPMDYVQALLLVKFIKTPDGQALFERLAEKWLDTQKSMVISLAQAGSANLVSAWANSHLIAMLLEHSYLIRKGGAKGLMDGLNNLVAAEEAQKWFTAIFGSEGLTFPQTVVFDQGEKVLERGETKGMTALLASILKK